MTGELDEDPLAPDFQMYEKHLGWIDMWGEDNYYAAINAGLEVRPLNPKLKPLITIIPIPEQSETTGIPKRSQRRYK